MANLELTPIEVVALVKLLATIDAKTYMVTNAKGELTFIENLDGVETLMEKINTQLGDDEAVKTYLEELRN